MKTPADEENDPMVSEEELRAAFDLIDSEKKGEFTFNDLCMAMEELGLRWGMDEAKTVFKKLDTDRNKSITFEEFAKAINIVLPEMEKFWGHLLHPASTPRAMEEEAFDFSMDEMIEFLKNKTTEWKKRIQAMERFGEICENMGTEEFLKLMKKLNPCLVEQLSERRSAVIKEVCMLCVNLAKAHPTVFSRFVPQLFPALFQCVRMNIQIMSKSGMMACANLVRFCEEDENLHLLRACVDGLEEQHSIVRTCCQTFLASILEKENLGDKNEDFWQLLFSGLQKGIGDSDQKARTECYNSIKVLQAEDLPQFERFHNQLAKSEQKRVDRALGTNKKRKRPKRNKNLKRKKALNSVPEGKKSSKNKESATNLQTPEAKHKTHKKFNISLTSENGSEKIPSEILNYVDQDEPVVETPPKRHEHGVDEIQVDSSSGVSSPKVGESLIFLNNLGYKQLAEVKEIREDGKLVVEWKKNNRRWSHSGRDERIIDDVYHEEQVLEGITEEDDEVSQPCKCSVM